MKPFRPGRSISGFRTGPLGMGHVVLTVTSLAASLPFYCDLLGFRISDYIRAPINAYFLHANPRHHSVALFEAPHAGMHHLMVELFSFDDVGQGYDIALGEKDRIVATLGRHPNDLVTSFYVHTPSDILVEYGWGGREVDDATWQPVEMNSVASFWGHHGLFEAVAGDGPAADRPMSPSPDVQRAPLAGDGRQLPAAERRVPLVGFGQSEGLSRHRQTGPVCPTVFVAVNGNRPVRTVMQVACIPPCSIGRAAASATRCRTA